MNLLVCDVVARIYHWRLVYFVVRILFVKHFNENKTILIINSYLKALLV